MRWPAEGEPHELTLMGWPCRAELWGETIDQARSDYAAVANAIAAFEPVTMIANPGRDAADARAACAGGVTVLELGLDDSWLRDCGPIYTVDGASRRGVHFRFNAWGEKYPPCDRDAAVGALVVQALGDAAVSAPIQRGRRMPSAPSTEKRPGPERARAAKAAMLTSGSSAPPLAAHTGLFQWTRRVAMTMGARAVSGPRPV